MDVKVNMMLRSIPFLFEIYQLLHIIDSILSLDALTMVLWLVFFLLMITIHNTINRFVLIKRSHIQIYQKYDMHVETNMWKSNFGHANENLSSVWQSKPSFGTQSFFQYYSLVITEWLIIVVTFEKRIWSTRNTSTCTFILPESVNDERSMNNISFLKYA